MSLFGKDTPSAGKKSFLGIFFRGLAMGAADVVPGVSGGTIALITGIYEELIETISSLNFGLFRVWKNEGFKAAWNKANATFLLALLAGIGISIVSLAKLIEYLLNEQEILLWSFFFGLIIASIWLVGKTVERWYFGSIAGLICGGAIAYFITISTPAAGSESLFYIFFSGMIAICAMILPGISGSFILILLGSYLTVLGSIGGLIDALKAQDWSALTSNGLILLIFMAGCLIGLIAFSKLLNFLFKKSKSLMIAILTGFLVGSLNKIWPWKIVLKWGEDRHGDPIPLVEENVLPGHFTELSGEPHHLTVAILLMLAGLGLILFLDFFGNRLKKD